MTHENDPIDMQVQVGPSRKLRGVGREEDSFRQDSKAVTTLLTWRLGGEAEHEHTPGSGRGGVGRGRGGGGLEVLHSQVTGQG